jgi:PAS domain S-box-containing protein
VSESERRFRALVEQAAVGIAVADLDGRLVEANGACRRLLGYAEGELTGMHVRDITHPADAESSLGLLEELLAGECDSYHTEKRYVRKDGSTLWGLVSTSLVRGEDGSPAFVVATIEDVDERKRAEDALNEAEARYRTLVEQLPLVIYIDALDERSSNVYTSPQLEPILGYSVEEWQSDPDLFVKALHPDDRARVLDEILTANESGERFASEYRLIARDGREVWFRDECVTVCDPHGTALYSQGYLLDITQRKRAEDAIRESEERFRSLVANVPGVIYRCAADPDWTMEFISDAVRELTGYPASDFIGSVARTYASVIHADDRPEVERLVDEAVRLKQPFELEYRVIHADGTVRCVSEKGQPIIGPAGEVVWLDGAIFDVTEQKQAEAELAKERELMRTFMENTPDHVFFKDEQSRFLRVSTALARWFGLDDPGEAIGKTDFDFFAEEHAARAFADEQRLLHTGEPMLNQEYREIWEDGRETWVTVWRLPLRDERGTITGTFGIARDTTERKRAEMELTGAKTLLDSIVENLPTPLFLKDAEELRFARVNRAAEELWGVGRDELVGKSDCDIFPPEQAEFFVAKDRQVIESKELLDIPDEPIETREFGTRYLHTRKVPIVGEDGRPQYLLGISLDITDSKLAQERLAAQNEQLRELDRMKDEFVALVSHELRTPLTSILGYLELVLEGDVGEVSDDQEHFLSIIERNAQRLLRLVGDLLFVAQIEAGKLAIERDAVDLLAVARDCIEAQQPRAAEKEIELGLDGIEVVGFQGDRVRLAQLLDNLVSNAIKFTPEGGRVDVRLSPDNGHVHLAVSDTGMGIPRDEQGRLFERFFRASGATQKAIQGTGLGLTISKAIVVAHGGSISVESEEGRGTTFVVDLPLAETGGVPTRPEPVPMDAKREAT